MFLIVNKYLLRRRFVGITLWPFIVVKHKKFKNDTVLINHERIHLKQQLEMLVLPFFIWYSLEYVLRLFQYRDRYKAYRNISFEREAYSNEGDPFYLKNRRKFWQFLRFL